jgi:HD-GYP domain-containing protein (c-di-GMP phosphodiesterase class II)
MDKLIKAIAEALDIVEGELLGASTHHGKRIAALSAAMGRYFGMDEEDLRALTVCALLHDNALTEYVLSERDGGIHDSQAALAASTTSSLQNKAAGFDSQAALAASTTSSLQNKAAGFDSAMKLHCEYGQRNVEAFGLKADINGYILYHHECASGAGPYGKKEGTYPLGAEIIGIADSTDVIHHLQRVPPEELSVIKKKIAGNIGVKHTARAAEAMLAVLDEEMLCALRDENILATSERFFLPWTVDVEDSLFFKLGKFISHIIDDKSVFTRKHCAGISQKAWYMAEIYGYDGSQRSQFHLAASLHDIGKLATPVYILEKPGKLTDDEFSEIKQHVYLTYKLLKDIDGFEDICAWASNHHEKLDGSGYHFGKNGADLDFNSRLLACLDIYQALTEVRPYHNGRDHKTAMQMLSDMGNKGLLDTGIIKDLDSALAEMHVT